MKRLVLIGVMAIVMSVMAAPAFAGWIISESSLNATIIKPGVVNYDGTIKTPQSAVETYVRVYEYNTKEVLDEAFPGSITADIALPFSGTLRFDGPIPGWLVVDLYGYDPVIVGQNRNKSIYHYVNWMFSTMSVDANAGLVVVFYPTVPGTYDQLAQRIDIYSPVVDAGVTELNFTESAEDQIITVTNDNPSEDLTITDVSTPDAPFSIVESCTASGGVIAPMGTCTITVSFDDGSAASIKGNNTLYAGLGSGILLLGIGLAFAPKGSKSTIVIMLLAVTLSMGVLQACGSDDSKDYTIRITSDDPNGTTKIDLIK